MSIHRGIYSVQAALIIALLLHLGLSGFLLANGQPHEKNDGVFNRFTRHIQQRVETDKIAFTKASGCTNRLYQQEKQKPAPAPVSPIRFNPVVDTPNQEACLRDYPGGLDAVRKDFQKTQTSLSVSLTFYEFALVGDRDDDERYSAEELRDVFQSLDLPYDPAHPASIHATELAGRFDAWYHARNLESLMHGMERLYEKGYRVSSADRGELDRVMK
jgi:hypothetical protein